MLGDHYFTYPTVELVRKLVEKKIDVYLYNFEYDADSFKDFWPNEDALSLNYTGKFKEYILFAYSTYIRCMLCVSESF